MIKKILFAITFSVLILISSDHVFAKTIKPYEASINSTFIYQNGNQGTTNIFYGYSDSNTPNFYLTFRNIVPSTNYYTDYPYLVVYFKSNVDNLQVARTGASCSNSCFNSDLTFKKVGNTQYGDSYGYRNGYDYILVLSISKVGEFGYPPNPGVEDVITFANYDNQFRSFAFYNVLLSDTNPITNNDFELINNLINSSNNNTNTIVNNITNLGNVISSNATYQSSLLQQQIQEMIDDGWLSGSEQKNFWNDAEHVQEGSISDIITMPITLITAYLDSFDDVCSPFVLGSLYGENLVLPCIDIKSFIGAELWTIIDTLFSGFMIYNICMKFVKVFKSFTDLDDKDSFDDMFGGVN